MLFPSSVRSKKAITPVSYVKDEANFLPIMHCHSPWPIFLNKGSLFISAQICMHASLSLLSLGYCGFFNAVLATELMIHYSGLLSEAAQAVTRCILPQSLALRKLHHFHQVLPFFYYDL